MGIPNNTGLGKELEYNLKGINSKNKIKQIELYQTLSKQQRRVE